MASRDGEGWHNSVFCDDGRKREIGDEDGNDMEDTSRYENSRVRHAWLGWEDLVSVFLPAASGVVPAVSGKVYLLAHGILLSPSSSWWFPPSPLISLLLYHHLKWWSYVIPIYFSMQGSLVKTEDSIHWGQLAPSTVYTEYCIHRVLHTPSTASSQDPPSPAPSQSLIPRQIFLFSTLYIPTITS